MKKLSLLVLGVSAMSALMVTAAIFADPEPHLPTITITAPVALSATKSITTVAGMPPVINPHNLYSETGQNMFNPVVKDDLLRVYVPNLRSNSVTVIDPV